jgi:Zn-dependent protease
LPNQTAHKPVVHRYVHKLVVHHHLILGTSWTSLGALLIVVGSVLVIADAASGQGITLGGTYAEPKGRLLTSLALVGSLLVGVGASVLLVVAGVSLLAVIVVIAVTVLFTLAAMASSLRRHMDLLERNPQGAPHRSWWWCLLHPLWRPPDDR